MPAPNQSSAIIFLVIAALVAWRMYARFRRLIGRQRLSPRRPWITVSVFPVLLLLVAFGALSRPDAIAALLGGLVVGAALGAYGIRLTKFERTDDGLFYTPNAHIGIALSSLLAGRLLYRLATQMSTLSGAPAAPAPEIASSPLTLAIIATLAGYYVSYAIGLIRWQRQTPPAVPAPPGEAPHSSA